MAYFTAASAYAEYILIGSIAAVIIGLRVKKNLWKNLFSTAGILGTLLALSMLFSGGGFLPGEGSGGGDGSGIGTAGSAVTAARTNNEPAGETGSAYETAGDPETEDIEEAPRNEYVSEAAAAPLEEGTIRIRVTKDTVYFDEQKAENAEDLRQMLEESYTDGMQIILQDDYAMAESYDWAKETLDEFAAEYYETILK